MDRLKALALAVSVVLALGGAGPCLAQEPARFMSVIEDLPLMRGLVEDAGSETVFDSPQGRIVEAFATGPVSKGQVFAFYDETLPQLGWRRVAAGRFRREDEDLRVDFPGGPGAAPPLTVRFHLTPAGD